MGGSLGPGVQGKGEAMREEGTVAYRNYNGFPVFTAYFCGGGCCEGESEEGCEFHFSLLFL